MHRWTNWFADRGHEVYLASVYEYTGHNPNVKYIPSKRQIPIDELGDKINYRNLTAYLSLFRILREFLKNNNVDIVHGHYIAGHGFVAAATGFHPLALTAWGSDITTISEKNYLYRLLVRYALKRADLLPCGNRYIARRIKILLGDRGEIRIVKWGVDPGLFKPNKKIKDDKIRILYLRKSQDPYGIEILLFAIPKIIREHKNIDFIMLKSGKELNKTFDTIKKLGIEKYVNFIDTVPNIEMPNLMNMCDIYVDTFYREILGSGIGMTTLEAMSCELPVVLSNTAPTEFYIKHKASGYIYRGNDSKSLANGIIELIEYPKLRKKIGKKAREYIINNQNWNENMKLMEAFYEKLNKGGIRP
jgi:glycosyltransferase involved in cell wall biosynthesis